MGLTDENIVKSLLRFFKSKLCKKTKVFLQLFVVVISQWWWLVKRAENRSGSVKVCIMWNSHSTRCHCLAVQEQSLQPKASTGAKRESGTQ